MSFDPPLEHRDPTPKARGFSKSSLYFQLLFLICYNEFPNSSLKRKIEKTLNILVIFQQVLPEDFYNFIEHRDYETSKAYEMKHLTKRVRGYIILMRHMGKYILDKNEGYERNLSDSFNKFHHILPGLYNQMLEQDEKEATQATEKT